MTIEYANTSKKKKAYYKSKEWKELCNVYSTIGHNEQKQLDKWKKSKEFNRKKRGKK